MHRAAALLFLALMTPALHAQEVRINEVLAGHVPEATDRSDRIELYNAGSAPVDLDGYTISLNGAAHRITGALVLPARGLRVLWCDRHPELGNDHLDLKLPRTGGSVLLIAPDRTRVLDLFTWPELPPGVSMGRVPDGARQWGYFALPSPGLPNDASAARQRLLAPPTFTTDEGRIALTAAEGASIHYTWDGSVPTPDAPCYTAPLQPPPHGVLRARAFAPDGITSRDAVLTPGLPPAAFALTLDPADLTGAERGLFTQEHFARKGRDWERAAVLEAQGQRLQVGLAVSGSGTRSAPKKNLKLFARDRFGTTDALPLAEGGNELILRADATPNALLRNLFMAAVAVRSGARVDVQPSTVLPLYINGRPFGTYRAMPAKNSAWVEQLAHGADVDLIDGPGGHAIAGKDDRYRTALAALRRSAPVDSLEQLVDLNSLIELACFDLWTGRADHDLNVRCWRPRTDTGRFRWILYDMDLWPGPNERSVDRMVDAATMEAPFLDQLLAHPVLRERLLRRFSTLLSTTLSPTFAAPLADSLFQAVRPAMQQDLERWGDVLPMPSPAQSHDLLQAHIAGRAPVILEQLARHAHATVRTISLEAEPRTGGTLTIDGLEAGGSVRGFKDVPLTIRAVPRPGMEFVGWKGINSTEPTLTVVPGRTKHVRAVFRAAGLSGRNGL